MRASLALFGFATALALPILGSATNLNYNFINDVPAFSNGVAVGSSKSFMDTSHDATTITASMDPNISIFGHSLFSLYEKNGGGNEEGLGVTPSSDNEINKGLPGIKLDLSSLLALDPTSISISLNSVQSGEVGTITYLDGDHDNDQSSFQIKDQNSHKLDLTELAEEHGSIWVTATSGNVLIADVAATTTPEPAAAGLIGIGLLLAGGVVRRAKKA